MNHLPSENGIPVGNQLDKSNPGNPFYAALIRRFDGTLRQLVLEEKTSSIHEVGCGEGRVANLLHGWTGLPIRASEYSSALTGQNIARNDPGVSYIHRPMESLVPSEDTADLIVCCEVLEHLPAPAASIAALRGLNAPRYIFSVPNEPLWRILNICRLKYISALGNTPGHLNHWSKRSFIRFLHSNGFLVRSVRTPLPWIMVSATPR